MNGDALNAAQARSLANPEFGPGGSLHAYVPDLDGAIGSNHLVKVGEDHRFLPSTTTTDVEDPRYRAADATLPDRALDPDRERREVHREGLGDEAKRAAAGAIAAGLYARVEQSEGNTTPEATGAVTMEDSR